ncbi:PKD repeat protein [Methanocalculus alkaliphilus]|uniref:PKD domain-containing protein n=1 Tax=Methanocalculus alkaliphilus TaxID=768730 RepID=UPI00209E629F|nr:PKD domain-containing protein [Methanocalculus alkaliphilus]MCP1716288.1 PKD repeat protein [Methanocalculus alkaliphilus]
MMMRRYIIILVSLFLVLALPAAVAAATVTINNASEGEENVVQGGNVTIQINNLENNQNFKLEMSSVDPDHLMPSGLELYRLDNFDMPFSLKNGAFNAEGTNLEFMKYEAKRGNTIAGLQKNHDNNIVTITETRDWNKGIYDYIEVTGKVADPGQSVQVNFSVNGTTSDAVGSHELKFAIKGASDGKVNVKVLIDNDEKANVTLSILSTDVPEAAITADTTTGDPPLTVQFTDASSGNPTQWAWNFGDGQTSTSQNPKHTYNDPGRYTVMLTVTNAAGSDTITNTNYIRVGPVADFIGTPTRGLSKLTVAFTDSSKGADLTYKWERELKNAGWTEFSTVKTPPNQEFTLTTGQTHEIYRVRLTVTNEEGSNAKIREFIVVAPPQPHNVSANVDPTGNVTDDIAITYESVDIQLPKGTVARKADGNPVTEITTGIASNVVDPPVGSIKIGNKTIVLGPSGATFSPPGIPITIKFTQEEWDELFTATEETKLKRYDGNQWVDLDSQVVDHTNRKITGYTTSFSNFAPVTVAKVTPTPTPTPRPGGGGGFQRPAPPEIPSVPTVTTIGTTTLAVDAEGFLANNYVVESPTGIARLRMPAGTLALDSTGNQLSSVSMSDLSFENVPSAPEGAVFSFAGSAVVCSPAGATFSPAISLLFQMTPQQLQHIEETGDVPSIQWYNVETATWEYVPTTYDQATGTVTATVDHFTIFGLFYLSSTVDEAAPIDVTPTPPVYPDEPAPFPWTYLIVGVIIILLIAGGVYYYSRK